jgi:DNA helicase-2/ATP-dependent DNA helicase PcrA
MVLKSLIGNDKPNIMLVGDEKQCIYGFIGSDSKFMTDDFVNDYQPIIFELTENFRSSRNVLEFANKIIPESTEIKDVVKEGILELHDFSNPKEEAKYVCDKIKELIIMKTHPDIEGDITYNKISVLGRTKYVLQSVEDALQQNGIPYFYKNTQKTFELESSLGKIFELALKVKINSNDFLHMTELRNSLDISQNVTSISELSSHLQNSITKHLIDSIVLLDDDGTNFINVLKKISEKIPTESSCDDSEKALAYSDFEAIKKAWYKYAKTTNNKSLIAFHNSISLGQSSSFEEKNGVALSTVHTMKGQENDIVFLVGMDDGTFPDYRAVQKGGVELQQERNDLYVAVTRAKRFLYITYPKERTMPWGSVFYRKKSSLLP